MGAHSFWHWIPSIQYFFLLGIVLLKVFHTCIGFESCLGHENEANVIRFSFLGLETISLIPEMNLR